MGYAFISYSTANQSAADSVRKLLEGNGVSTWMAPYNIPAGCEYAEVICDALSGCSCIVLILTDKSQSSVWVKKEINLAVSDGKTIIPIKLEDIVLNSSMRLYLNDQQIVTVNELNESSADMQKVLKAVCACTDTPYAQGEKANVSQEGDGEEARVFEITDVWECYRRGYNCEVGVDTPVDLKKAAYWYEMGALQGNSWCQHRMGEFCLCGLGIPQSYSEAIKWYSLGAALKDDSCCLRLAECYENGWGVTPDPVLAAEWREKAKLYKKP